MLYQQEVPAGYALYFYNFSTFLGRPGIFLEDVFVRPRFRRLGLGRAVFDYLGGLAREKNLGRLEFTVLDWNQPAIDFYQEMGADILPDWRVCRFTGPSLARLGQGRED